MLSRRSFMLVSSAAVLSRTAPPVLAQRAQPPAFHGPLPPSIAALQSLTGQVRPVSNEERQARIEKARRLMAQYKIGAIILCGGASSLYFANLQIGGSERLWALVIPVRNDPFLVCPAFEEDRARELLANTPFAGRADIRLWQEDESPYVRLIQGLKDRGISGGRIGIEETVKFVFADGIARAGAPAFTAVSATPVTAGCRMIKDEHEVAFLRLAGKATLQVYEAVYKALQEGMTQRDVSALIQAGYARVGFPGEASLNIGEYTASPHGSRAPQTIREGTIIMLDDGCRVEGYTSDITRTFVLGKPSEKMVRVFATVRRAQSRAPGSSQRRRGRGRPRRDHGGGLRTGLQILHAPGGARPGHGNARVELPGEEQYVRLRRQTDLAGGHGFQRRTRHLHPRRIRSPPGGRYAHHRRRCRASDCAQSVSGASVRIGAGCRSILRGRRSRSRS